MGAFRQYQSYQPVGAVSGGSKAVAITAVGDVEHTHVELSRAVRGARSLLAVGNAAKVVIAAAGGLAVATAPVLTSTDKASIVYALVVLLFKVDARISFGLALIGLVEIACLHPFGYDQYMQIIATAVFYLLFVGLLSAARERTGTHKKQGVYRLDR